MNLSFAPGVLDTIRQEFLSGRGPELCWILFGLRDVGSIRVQHALLGIPKDVSQYHVEIDREEMADRSFPLFARSPQLKVLGSVHTHFSGDIWPSLMDYAGHMEWIEHFSGPGVFGIGIMRGPIGMLARPYLSWYTLALGDED